MEAGLFIIFCLVALLVHLAWRHDKKVEQLLYKMRGIEVDLEEIQQQIGSRREEEVAETLNKLRTEFPEYADEIIDSYASLVYNSSVSLMRNWKKNAHLITTEKNTFRDIMDIHERDWVKSIIDGAPPKLKALLRSMPYEIAKERFRRFQFAGAATPLPSSR